MLAKRYSSDRTAAIKRTKDRSSSTAPEPADRLARRADLFFPSATSAQVFHQLSTRFPQSRFRRLSRGLGAALAAVAVVAPHGLAGCGGRTGRRAAGDSTYRLFLRDGSSVATIGEFARTGDRVVVTIGLGDRLTMATVPAAQVDWARTDRYTESVRAAHYAATRGEADFAAMSAIVARTLSDVAVTPGPRRAARARRAGPPPARRVAARPLRLSRRGSAADAGPARRGDRRPARRRRPDDVRRRLRRQRPAAAARAGAAAADAAGHDRAGAAAVAARRRRRRAHGAGGGGAHGARRARRPRPGSPRRGPGSIA